MDYEKKYKEALERAKKWYNAPNVDKIPTYANRIIEELFPELKESEDGRIRKALISILKTDFEKYTTIYGISVGDIIVWLEKQGQKPKKVSIWKHWKDGIAGNGEGKLIFLVKSGGTYRLTSSLAFECDYIELSELDDLVFEKQGEQKPTDKVGPKFKVGDWVASNYNNVGYIESISETKYNLRLKDGYHEKISIEYIDRYWHLWSIKDAKPGDVIAEDPIESHPSSFVAIYKKQNEEDFEDFDSYCFVGFDGKFYENEDEHYSEDIHPATKEQRDLLFQKMKESGYTFDFEKKELKKIDDEEVNGEDYGIDGLWHAQRILEKTLGSVDGYQTDDGILDHKAAITAVKKLYEQKPAWSEEDRTMAFTLMRDVDQMSYISKKGKNERIGWLNSLDEKFASRESAWSEEDMSKVQRICKYLNEAKKYYADITEVRECMDWLKSLKQRIGG